jgi:hypothetical protein
MGDFVARTTKPTPSRFLHRRIYVTEYHKQISTQQVLADKKDFTINGYFQARGRQVLNQYLL